MLFERAAMLEKVNKVSDCSYLRIETAIAGPAWRALNGAVRY
jgi:hypothetical protein